jgi:hypothetical protein
VQPAPPPEPPVFPPAPVEAPLAAPPPPPAPPDRLAVGKNEGFFQPSALLQFWGFWRDVSGETPHTTNFRLRRAELRVKGEVAPKLVAYNLMIDAAKLAVFTTRDAPVEGGEPTAPPATVEVPVPPGDASILQDYFITFLSDYADVSLGQFKTQISWEGFNGSSKTIFPERSAVSRAYGDRRDIGFKIEKKLGDHFFYSAGLYNGAGLNRADNDNEKDVALRLEVYPIKGLTLAAAGHTTTFGDRDQVVRDRVEGDVRYEGHDFLFQAEYIHAWDGLPEATEDGRLEGHGGYAALGYTFIERIQPVFRIGLVDPNVNVEDNGVVGYELGVNYYLRQNEVKLSLAGAAFDPQVEGGDTAWEGTLAAQLSF